MLFMIVEGSKVNRYLKIAVLWVLSKIFSNCLHVQNRLVWHSKDVKIWFFWVPLPYPTIWQVWHWPLKFKSVVFWERENDNVWIAKNSRRDMYIRWLRTSPIGIWCEISDLNYLVNTSAILNMAFQENCSQSW